MRLILTLFAFSLIFATPALALRYLSIDAVRAMAFHRGIVRLKTVELHNGTWEVEGFDASGHKIKMEVDAATGVIIKLKRKG